MFSGGRCFMTPARRFRDVRLYGTSVNQSYAFAIKTRPMAEPQSLTSLRYRVGSRGKVLLHRNLGDAHQQCGATLQPRRDPATQNRPNSPKPTRHTYARRPRSCESYLFVLRVPYHPDMADRACRDGTPSDRPSLTPPSSSLFRRKDRIN